MIEDQMPIMDLHSHWSTQRGYVFQSKESQDLQGLTFRSHAHHESEEQMAAYFRKHHARAILDLGFTKSIPLEEAARYNDYAMETQRQFPDAIYGNWIQLDPRTGVEGAKELQRCISASAGFISFCVSAPGMGFPASDPIYAPFYDVCLRAGRPILVLVGYTGAGAGSRGGSGLRLDLAHPRYVDELAIQYPDLKIIAGRPAWPWQDEMIAVMLHKPNVWAELHGWSPKYFTDSLKKDIPRRLRDRIMFGSDYPLLKYERLIADWKGLGYDADVLKAVFHGNADRLFANCA